MNLHKAAPRPGLRRGGVGTGRVGMGRKNYAGPQVHAAHGMPAVCGRRSGVGGEEEREGCEEESRAVHWKRVLSTGTAGSFGLLNLG